MVAAQLHRRWPWLVGAVLLFVLGAEACDTPVYEYTLRYWYRDPYRVCYLYRGTEAAADAAVNTRLEQLGKMHANMRLIRIDADTAEASAQGSLAQYVWERHGSEALPRHVVLTPRGVTLFSGRLELAAIEGFAKSSKRTQMMKQLCEGKQGVLVLLKGPLAGENAMAEKVVRAVIERAKEEQLDVGLVVVRRDDPREQWLVWQLLTLEPDLKDLKNAMVFAVFGRGHVLEPYLGKGITEMNVADVIWFINGPCACEIKMAAPGMDLLTDWDWDRHIAALPESQWGPLEFGIVQLEGETPAAVTEQEAAAEELEAAPEPAEPEPQPAPEQERAVEAEEPAAAPEPEEVAKEAPEPTDEAQAAAGPAAPAPAPEKADAESAPAQETARGPLLPRRAARATEPDDGEQERASLASVLGQRLGWALGAAVIVAVLAGVVLLKTRKES